MKVQPTNHGDLKVWWIPQIPMKAFNVRVANLIEARLLLDTLARYDEFQLRHRVKPDYSNAGGLMVFDESDNTDGPDGSWTDWYDSEGENIDHYTLDELRAMSELPKWESAK